ncbi:SusC/RagA family TonB-linked outer membrane protein [Flavobacterium sp. CYK-55]|uniref:SusC/RagA family TonB-linked outer membrane protein n=1 Tax=Flavobacterium sp. CYK-55 TaxID=2835529 RepID=UPI001BCCEE67|nr:SusC/RagA family TonB-linked outer membrane protein [Flavobacterium sp. CYK-55]MBS7785692.1 SusC/RagA family TonB-linked outer membrane protein [Flavobacterium sp. CYK-55]
MRSKFKWIFTLVMVFTMQLALAQEKTVSGVVSDDQGPLPGANVMVKGTKNGVQTDVDGKFAIKAKTGDVLIVSFIGYDDKPVTVGASNVVNIKMKTGEGEKLNEVVVTSQGIKKEKKALGYAVTTIKAEDFASKPSTDVARALTGKAPGVNIQQTSGLSGSGTNIIIRGYSSITGSNQPLFVVDGIPFNAETNSDGNFLEGATNASSRFLDLDPNSIESISILKGLSATTLYGSSGRNGVVLVTTKSGNTKEINKKMDVAFTQSLYMTEISALPDYQNRYGNGFDNLYTGAFSNWGPAFGTVGTQGIGADGTVSHPLAYYGPDTFPQFWNFDQQNQATTPKTVPYAPQNNVKPFFRTGVVTTTSLNIGGRSENTSYNVGVGHTRDEGFIENNTYQRLNLTGGGRTKLTNGFTLSSTINYVRTDKTAPPTAAGFGSNAAAPSVFANILYTPRNLDLFGMPYENPIDHSSVNYRPDIPNPRWTLKNSSDNESVRRFFGNMTAMYEINSWSNVSYRFAVDNYTQNKKYYINRGNGQPFDNEGFLRTTVRENTIYDHTVSYNFDRKIDKNENWNLDGTLGFNPRFESKKLDYLASTSQFLYGLIEHQNFENHDGYSEKQSFNIVGLYASTTLGYKKYIYLNLQGRNDWYSSLQPSYRSLFYPSASVSFIPTEAIAALKGNKYINYAKLRVGYGSSAGFPDPYKTMIGLNTRAKAFLQQDGTVVNTLSPSNELGNLKLKPELVKELEFGFESKLFDNRLGIDLSLYNKVSTNLIVERDLDPSTGYDYTTDNVAQVSNKGIELGLNLAIFRPKKDDGFTWDATINFTRNRNYVDELGLGSVSSLAIAGFTNLGNFAISGQPYGVIMGSSITRDVNGNYVVGADGNYLVNNELSIIGDPNPDWKSTVINEFSYKNITFGFQFEYQRGGDIYSTTAAALLSRGLTEDTNFDRSGTFVLPGVNVNGNVNTTQIGLTQYGFNNSGFFVNEQAIYDATNLRLREVSLSYSLPKKWLEKTPFGKMSISFVGQNLWFKAFNFPKHLNFDPEVMSLGVGNGQGFDYLTGPTAKRYGFNFNLTF